MRRNACYELCVPMAAKFTDSLRNTRMNRCDNVRCSERERGRERENRKKRRDCERYRSRSISSRWQQWADGDWGSNIEWKILKNTIYPFFMCVEMCRRRRRRFLGTWVSHLYDSYIFAVRTNELHHWWQCNVEAKQNNNTHTRWCVHNTVCVCAQIVECRREWKLNQLHSPSTAIRHVVCVCETRLWISYSDFFGRKSSDVSSTFWVNGKLFWARNPALISRHTLQINAGILASGDGNGNVNCTRECACVHASICEVRNN